MTSVSCQYSYSHPARKSVSQCHKMGKLSSISVVASENPSRRLPSYQKVEILKSPKSPKVRTRQSHLSSCPALRNPRQRVCETNAVSAVKTTSYEYRHMEMIDELPKGHSINSIVRKEDLHTSYHLRAHRKRGFPEAKGGRRISVLRFKKQKTDDEDVPTVGPETDPNSWSRDKDLSPVACSLAHVVPVRGDQRQTEMERQENIGSPTESDILPPPKHNINFSTSHDNITWNNSRRFDNHQLATSVVPRNFHREHHGQSLPLHQHDYSIGRSSTILDYQQRYDLDLYQREQNNVPKKSGKYADDLERGMQHFLQSEVEATHDVTHPWHDMMSSTAVARQQAARNSSNIVYQTSDMSLLMTNGTQFDQLSFSGDHLSPSSLYPAESWGRGDAAPGESSPDPSSSDSLSPIGRNYYESGSPSSIRVAGGTISPHTSSASSSTSGEISQSLLEPLADEGRIMLDAVNGFLMVVDHDCRVLYVSENVTEHLGFPQADMLGSDIRDYIHSQDIKELDSHLKDVQFLAGVNSNPPTWMTRRMFYLGMKFSFFRPGTRSKESGYTLVQCSAKLRLSRKRSPAPQEDVEKQQGGRKKACPQSRRGRAARQKGHQKAVQESQQEEASSPGLKVKTMIILCRPVRTESVLEIRPDGNMFISRHDLGFHFIFCDPRVFSLIGYQPSDMHGRTAYQFHSPWDAIICKHCAKQLILSGTATSGYYRFLSRTGAWVWMVTSATIIFDTQRQPQYIVCKNYVVSPTVAERDLSRQRRDFDMMKYPGFTLETNQTLSLTSNKVGAETGPNGDTRKRYSYGESMSLVTLDPKLGEVDPNAMLEKLLASKQVDISNSPFHLARARKRATRSLQAGSTKSFPNELNHSGDSPFVSKDFVGSSIVQSMESTTDIEMNVCTDSQKYSDFPENQNQLSQSSYMQDARVRSSSPILTSLWRRDDQDTEFLTRDFSVSAEPVRMDSSVAYDFLASSTLENSAGYSISGGNSSVKNPVDRGEFVLGFNSNTLNDEDSGLQRDPFPILTTTNIYSLDFASDLSDTLSSDLSSFQSFLDPPQSIPLTSATSFSDGHDFLFPSTNTSRFLDDTFPAYAPMVETGNCDRMDTPVCFDTPEFEIEDNNMGNDSAIMTPRGSKLVDSTPTSTEENCSGQEKSKIEGESNTNSSNDLCKNITSAENGVSFNLTPNLAKQALSLDALMENEMSSETSSTKQLYHPSNVTILNNTVFQGGKISIISSRTDKNSMRNGVDTSKSTNQSNESLNIKMSLPHSGREKDNHNLKTTPSTDSPNAMISQSMNAGIPETGSSSRNGISNNAVTLMEENEEGSSELNYSFLQNTNTIKSLGNRDASQSLMPTINKDNCHFSSSPVSTSPVHNESETVTRSPQTSPTNGVLSPTSSCVSTAHTQSLFDSSSSSDSDTPGRPSLLRTLLDKEGAAIQGPITYAEWVLQKALKNKGNTEKNDAFSKTISGKRAASRKSRIKRGNVKKSTELPLPVSSQGSVRYGKEALQQRRQTTELPLPSVSLAKSPDPYFHQSRTPGERPSSIYSDGSSSNISADDISLPDDLLDLAVEYCGSMGPEQTDALLSDFTEISSIEDNLFSLVRSPAQNKGQENQSKTGFAKLISEKRLSDPGSRSSHFTSGTAFNNSGQLQTTSLPEFNRASIIPNDSKTVYNGNHNQVRHMVDTSLKDAQGLKLPNPKTATANGNPPMSLLRAAVTTPDVDKLIEQIPFGNHGNYNLNSSDRLSNASSDKPMIVDRLESNKVDPDIMITKVMGLNNFTEQKTSRGPPQGELSKNYTKLGNEQPSKTNGKLDAIFFDHIYTASMVSPQPTTPIDTSALSSSMRINAHSVPKHSSYSLINSNSFAGGKTSYNVSLVSQNVIIAAPNNSKTKHSATSRVKSTTNTISLCPTRSSVSEGSNGSGSSSKNDLSSTEPVSVMIMRKEAHRSRRSKSIAVQTDNAPGEVYPEFERSPNDIILYPRNYASPAVHSGSNVLRQNPAPNSTATSPAMSPSPSTPTHSPQCMSQLERFLRGYPSSGDNDAVTSPDEGSYSPSSFSSTSGPGTPFLQRLLTGELSKDNYRRLDEQMREDERRLSGSSASDLELPDSLC